MATGDDFKMIDALRSLIDYAESQRNDEMRISLHRLLKEVVNDVSSQSASNDKPLSNVVALPLGGVGKDLRK